MPIDNFLASFANPLRTLRLLSCIRKGRNDINPDCSVDTLKNHLCRSISLMLLCFCISAHAQFSGELSTNNGTDNNPNQAPNAKGDVVGEHTLMLSDSLRAFGASYFLPSYSFKYNTFVVNPVQSYVTHSFGLSWTQPEFFMPRRVAEARKKQHILDSIEEEKSTDSVKDGLVARLHAVGDTLDNADIEDTTDQNDIGANTTADTSSADTSAADTTGANDEDSTEADTSASASDSSSADSTVAADTSTAESDTSSAGSDSTEAESPQDSLKDKFVASLNAMADSLDGTEGTDSLKLAITKGVLLFERAIADSFPHQPFIKQAHDSLEAFIGSLRRYIPPPKDTSKDEDDTTIYVAVSLPRSSMYDYTESDVSLETTDDDTASYDLTIGTTYDYLLDASPGDSLGSGTLGATLQLNQSPDKAFNIYESAAINHVNYATLDTMNNTQYLFSVQGRMQPSTSFTGLFELGYGVKDYDVQEVDSVVHPVTKKVTLDKSTTVATQVSLGLGAFWRIFKPTMIGAMFYYLNNPSNKARIAAAIRLNRRFGFNTLFDDRFSYSGPELRVYFKQYIFDKIQLGLNYTSASPAYNQVAYDVTKVKNVTVLVPTKNQRKDTQEAYELQLTRDYDVNLFFFTQFTPELLIGSIKNNSNDPTFVFHEGYVMLNLSLDF